MLGMTRHGKPVPVESLLDDEDYAVLADSAEPRGDGANTANAGDVDEVLALHGWHRIPVQSRTAPASDTPPAPASSTPTLDDAA